MLCFRPANFWGGLREPPKTSNAPCSDETSEAKKCDQLAAGTVDIGTKLFLVLARMLMATLYHGIFVQITRRGRSVCCQLSPATCHQPRVTSVER